MLPPLPAPSPEEPVTNTSSLVTTARVKLVRWGSSCWHKQLGLVGCRNILRIVHVSRPPLHEESVCFGSVSCSRQWGKSWSQDLPWHGCVVTSALSCRDVESSVENLDVIVSVAGTGPSAGLSELPFYTEEKSVEEWQARGFTF